MVEPARWHPLAMRTFLVAIVAVAGCRSPADAVLGPLDDPWAAEQSRCSVRNSRANPLIVEWPAAERGSLEMRLRRGLVAVRYQGCDMEVLRHCTVPDSRYEYGGFTRKAETVRMRNADELYANLPVGAARLEGRLERAKALEVSMTMVGMYQADRESVMRQQLRGDCDSATHVIAGVQVGAYAFTADGRASVAGSAGMVNGPGLGAGSQSGRELIEQDGLASSCASASSSDLAPPEGCGALLRLEVIPIDAPATVAAACPEGTAWDGAQCSSPRSPQVCPAGFSDRGDGCVRASFCPEGLTCGSGSGGTSRQRCAAGMSWIPGARADESFCLDDTEVTAWAYQRCVDQGGCPAAPTTVEWQGIDPREQDAASELCNGRSVDRLQHPMNCVTWHAADTFCRWRGARLPTEQEFTWAARGGDEGRSYAWGNAPPSSSRVNACGEECRAWFRHRDRARERIAYRGDDGWPHTAIVGSFPAGASRWGPLDLAGNVAEWTASWADGDHTHRRLLGGSFLVQRAPWLSTEDTARAAPDRRDAGVGFRCAR